MARRKSPDELRKKPSKRRAKYSDKKSSYSKDNRKMENPNNDIYSHSKDKSFDLSRMGNRAKNKKSHNTLVLTNVLLSILLVISIVSFTGFSLLDSQFFKKKDIDANETKQYEDIMRSPNENVSYFLVCGVDLSENLTDIIMVVCYDTANNEASILQIPRDTFVGDVPSGKINAVFGNPREGESKIKALMRCINTKLGIPIDHYITVTISGTEKVIDIMGGVDLKLDRTYNLIDDSRQPEVKKSFGPGEVHFDGQWATAMLRHRSSFAQGDLGRLKNQRSVYTAILKQLTSISFSEATEIVTKCMDEVSTDLPLGLALGYAEKVNQLKLNEVEIMTLPGQTSTINGLSCWVVHKQEAVDLLNEKFRPYDEELLLASDLEIKDYSELGSSYNNDYGQFLEGGDLNKFDKDQE